MLLELLAEGGSRNCGVLCVPQRVHVPNNWVLGDWLIGIVVQVLGKYTIIGYLDPLGSSSKGICAMSR